MRSDYQQITVPRPLYEAIRAEHERTDIPMGRLVRRAWETYTARDSDDAVPAGA
jgi:hypothetical protein